MSLQQSLIDLLTTFGYVLPHPMSRPPWDIDDRRLRIWRQSFGVFREAAEIALQLDSPSLCHFKTVYMGFIAAGQSHCMALTNMYKEGLLKFRAWVQQGSNQVIITQFPLDWIPADEWGLTVLANVAPAPEQIGNAPELPNFVW